MRAVAEGRGQIAAVEKRHRVFGGERRVPHAEVRDVTVEESVLLGSVLHLVVAVGEVEKGTNEVTVADALPRVEGVSLGLHDDDERSEE